MCLWWAHLTLTLQEGAQPGELGLVLLGVWLTRGGGHHIRTARLRLNCTRQKEKRWRWASLLLLFRVHLNNMRCSHPSDWQPSPQRIGRVWPPLESHPCLCTVSSSGTGSPRTGSAPSGHASSPEERTWQKVLCISCHNRLTAYIQTNAWIHSHRLCLETSNQFECLISI